MVDNSTDVRCRPCSSRSSKQNSRSFASCVEAICCMPKKRGMRIRLRAARAVCAQLIQNADVMRDASLPVDQLLAAEQSLAAIEAWISGVPSGVAHTASTGSIIRALGGPAPQEDEDYFFSTFPPVAGERLICMFSCSAKANSVMHPGRLFLSSARICFQSIFVGMDTRFDAMCQDLSSAKLTGLGSPTEDGAPSKHLAHPVCLTFKSPVLFSGEEVEQVELLILDLESLGHVHRCAMYFTCSGLFGVHPEVGVGQQLPHIDDEDLSSNGMHARSAVEKHVRQIAVWQLQRRTTIWHDDWRAPFLPHDGQKGCSWTLMEGGDYLQHPFLPNDAVTESDAPPIDEVDFMGKMRHCTWKVVADAGGSNDGADENGWQYAVDFYTGDHHWSPEPASFSHVRRRLWYPQFEEQAALRRQRLMSTMLVEKGLAVTSAQATQLCSIDIGKLPLETLGEALNVESWTEKGSLMFNFFDTLLNATDLEVGSWTPAAKLEGSVRSVQMQVPVPPGPMCPAETRISSTWHLLCGPSKVVLESATMSLDVPYGDSFNVVTVDTFSIDDEGSGQTRMVRALEIEWVKSTWLKSMIQEKVASEVQAGGEKWAKLIMDWAAAAAAK